MPNLNPNDIFETIENEIKDVVDPEEIINIDIDDIDVKSQGAARELMDNISKLYFNEEFLKSQPNFRKRIESEIETLRINIKMRKADEIAHDILLKNIGMNPSNASMYRSLTEIQKSIINITTKIEDTIMRLSNMMKSYQMEISFESNTETSESDASEKTVYKGTKAFIEDMANEDDDDVDIPTDENI